LKIVVWFQKMVVWFLKIFIWFLKKCFLVPENCRLVPPALGSQHPGAEDRVRPAEEAVVDRQAGARAEDGRVRQGGEGDQVRHEISRPLWNIIAEILNSFLLKFCNAV
jgi:hypothetical protein